MLFSFASTDRLMKYSATAATDMRLRMKTPTYQAVSLKPVERTHRLALAENIADAPDRVNQLTLEAPVDLGA